MKGTNQLLMLQPWTAKDLTVRSLALRIRDLYENKSAQVKFLYQGPYDNYISIEEAFPSEPSGELLSLFFVCCNQTLIKIIEKKVCTRSATLDCRGSKSTSKTEYFSSFGI